MARIRMQLANGSTWNFGTRCRNSIWRTLYENGYSLVDSVCVADWAELAGIGEEFELDGSQIWIEE